MLTDTHNPPIVRISGQSDHEVVYWTPLFNMPICVQIQIQYSQSFGKYYWYLYSKRNKLLTPIVVSILKIQYMLNSDEPEIPRTSNLLPKISLTILILAHNICFQSKDWISDSCRNITRVLLLVGTNP